MRGVLFVLALSSLSGTVPADEARGRPLPEFRDSLPNGLQTVMVPLPGAAQACLALVLPAGRAFEPAGEKGVALLAARLATATESEGGSPGIVSRVGRLQTSFRICGAPDEAAALAESLARLTRPLAGAETTVRPPVRPAPTAEDLALDLLFEALFPDHPLGRPSLPVASRGPSVRAARAFQRSRYTPLGASLVATGDLGDPFVAARELGGPFRSWPVRAGAGVEPPREAGDPPSAVLRGSFPGKGSESDSSVILVGGRLSRPDSPEQRAAALTLIDMAWARLAGAQVSLDRIEGPAIRDGGVWVLGLRVHDSAAEGALELAVAALEGLAAGVVERSELEAARDRILAGGLAASGEEGEKGTAALDAERVLDLLLGLVLESSPGRGGAPPARGLIELSAALGSLGPEELRAEAAGILAADRRVVVAVESAGR